MGLFMLLLGFIVNYVIGDEASIWAFNLWYFLIPLLYVAPIYLGCGDLRREDPKSFWIIFGIFYIVSLAGLLCGYF